jgi:transposase
MHHQQTRQVVGGVDTHGEVHVAAAVDTAGRIIGTESFPSTAAGYRALLRWLGRHGTLVRVGVEGTGAYGAGLARFLVNEGVEVVEVNRPDRQRRRRRGKSDPVDAEAAARAALNGEAAGCPKSGCGPVESIRVLRVARRSAVKARTQAINQLHNLVVTAVDQLRSRLRDLRADDLVDVCARFRPGDVADPEEATKAAMRTLARRCQELSVEIADLDAQLLPLCSSTNPALLAAQGVGPEVAATLLVTAGDNPERMRSDASFAALCGASPIEASSGKVTRHRLNTGGDRDANNALWRIVMVRMASDQRTKNYVARRTLEGKTKREIIRCLKRHVAREIFRLLTNPPCVPAGADLRSARTSAGITLAVAARSLSTWPTRLSKIERGLAHDANLARRYELWLRGQKAA